MKKYFNVSELRDEKQSKVSIEKAVKTTKQLLYDEVLFDNYDNADEVLKSFSPFVNNE